MAPPGPGSCARALQGLLSLTTVSGTVAGWPHVVDVASRPSTLGGVDITILILFGPTPLLPAHT